MTDRRLEAAHACLRTTELPLKWVATRLGYASVSHFSQAFTRKFGVRPGSLCRAPMLIPVQPSIALRATGIEAAYCRSEVVPVQFQFTYTASARSTCRR